MTENQYNNNDKKIVKDMLNKIDKNYDGLVNKLDIPEPIYDNEGNLKNEKEVKSKLKIILPTLLVLWKANKSILTTKSIEVMNNTNSYINSFKININMPKTAITSDEWNNIVDDLIKEREKKVKIKQVINGNANILNKKVQDTVMQMYKDGKSWPQTSKELQKQFGYNKNKAKSIAITEKNYYKSESQLRAIDSIDGDVNKIWVHNDIAKEPRDSHVEANGQIADENGYFHIDGMLTTGPQHFGVPSEDINCHCTMRIEPKK